VPHYCWAAIAKGPTATGDVDLIAAILAELQAKLADEDLEVRFQDISRVGMRDCPWINYGPLLGRAD
jgi:hypothetical protein